MVIEMYRNHLKKPTVTINDSTWYNLNNTDGNLLNKSPLHSIILKLKEKSPFTLTALEVNFLKRNNIDSVILLSNQKISFAKYKELSKKEQDQRNAKKSNPSSLIRFGCTTEKEKANDPIALKKHLELKAQVALSEENSLKTHLEKQKEVNLVAQENEKKRLEKQKNYEASPQYKIDQENARLLAEETKLRLEQERLKQEKARYRRNLQQKYFDHEYLEFNELKRITTIAEKFEKSLRISKADAIWVFSHTELHPTDEFLKVYHGFEAKDCIEDYKKTKNKWKLINASSQYRKGLSSHLAKELLLKYNFNDVKESKLKSAYHTTFGGVERDLKNTEEAIEHAEKAHSIQPNNFRPCTLLGAIYVEQGSYLLGLEWYEKAKKLGAPERGINNELSVIIKKLSKEEQKKMLNVIRSKSNEQYRYLLRFVH